jgi:ribosomal protein L37AE/L43A
MSTYEPETTNEAWHLLRKIFLLLLLVTASALGLVLLSRQSNNVPPVLFDFLADASLGLLVGLGARFVLRDRGWFIQGLASAAFSIVGLSVLGFLTNWKSGIGPYQAGLVTLHWLDAVHIPLRLPLAFGQSAMDLMDVVHTVIAVDTSWMALRVWKPAPHIVDQEELPAPRLQRLWSPRPMQQTAIQPAAPALSIPSPAGVGIRPRIKRRKTGRPLISKPAPAIRPMRAKPRRAGSVRPAQSAVHLAVHEEHRCPYCLEPVKRNDSRGAVECQVCHTLHHKDCWDITGSCQVPHLNT